VRKLREHKRHSSLAANHAMAQRRRQDLAGMVVRPDGLVF